MNKNFVFIVRKKKLNFENQYFYLDILVYGNQKWINF